jgi:queuine tRNA-ribosyltransferase
MIVAFDEPTAPHDPIEKQREALDRTHRWADRSLAEHQRLGASEATGCPQALLGVVQGGSFRDLREESARLMASRDFDGFAIGGSYVKEDIPTAVRWACDLLPEDRPRHLLGIGEPEDILEGVLQGIDTFDCVAPTRLGRNGGVLVPGGKINLRNSAYVTDPMPVDPQCDCPSCRTHSRSYLAHLFRADEMLAATLASVHNLRFLIRFVARLREGIVAGEDLSRVAHAFLGGTMTTRS